MTTYPPATSFLTYQGGDHGAELLRALADWGEESYLFMRIDPLGNDGEGALLPVLMMIDGVEREFEIRVSSDMPLQHAFWQMRSHGHTFFCIGCECCVLWYLWYEEERKNADRAPADRVAVPKARHFVRFLKAAHFRIHWSPVNAAGTRELVASPSMPFDTFGVDERGKPRGYTCDHCGDTFSKDKHVATAYLRFKGMTKAQLKTFSTDHKGTRLGSCPVAVAHGASNDNLHEVRVCAAAAPRHFFLNFFICTVMHRARPQTC